MGARRSGREAALQMLFAVEASGASADQEIALFWRHFEAEPEGKAYADDLVRGVTQKREEVDARIASASVNWRLERMTRVDRNVMRLGGYELMFRLDVPRAVILDEAVELAKSFGGTDGHKYVNGVLDKAAAELRTLEVDAARASRR